MEDVILVTADSIRRDYADEFDFLGRFPTGTGVAASHYTRPSLASLLSSQYEAALTTEVVSPTLPEVLSEAGYTCLGFSPTPNTDARFGFDRGFDTYETFVQPGKQGSRLREYLAKFDVLRRVYYRFSSPEAKSENRPMDREVVKRAIEAFNVAEPPRFLWVHLMESHRPYGREDGISPELDRKAYFSSGSLSAEEEATIEAAYRKAIRCVDENVESLLNGVETASPRFVFTADHGEAFGDTGFYFHKGHKRSVAECITHVPLVTDNMTMETPASLLDISATICEACDLPTQPPWDGDSRRRSSAQSTITIAPWGAKATLSWQNFDKQLIARDTSVTLNDGVSITTTQRSDVDSEIEQQLRELGYRNAG